MRRVLIYGGTGSIGLATARALRARVFPSSGGTRCNAGHVAAPDVFAAASEATGAAADRGLIGCR